MQDKLAATAPASRTYSPREVAIALGASEASIKRWCDQGKLKMVKTPGGHRRISIASVLSHLRQSKLPLEKAEALGLPASVSQAEVVPLPEVLSRILGALESGSYAALREPCWAQYLAGTSLCDVCDNLLFPAFAHIGERWSHGTTEVYQERRACDLALRLLTELRWAVAPTATNAPRALGCTLENDPYQLPTRMVELALLEKGWRAQSLGSGIPAASIARAVAHEAPRLLWLSISTFKDEDSLRAEVAMLHEAAVAQKCALAIGGRALRDDVRKQLHYSFFGDSLAHLVAYAESLAVRS